ncbi:MAG: sigma 54-interacting transcriptional regulator [Labilithrix sp.]|nr:sigma 54-interacting transcriptional regulator [Labilithrix sp.]
MALPAVPLSLISPSSARAFVDLDERMLAAQPGVVIVRAPSEAHAPILAHAARRLRTSGHCPVDASACTAYAHVASAAPLFREVATQLGLAVLPSDPAACADAIAQAAIARRAAIVAPLPKDGTWDRAVATELSRAARSLLLVFVTAGDPPAFDGATIFELSPDLSASDKLRWLSAVAEEAQTDVAGQSFAALEAWWSAARRLSSATSPSFAALGETARAVLGCLALAGRSLPVSSLETLGDDAIGSLDELFRAGFVTKSGALVSLTPSCDGRALETSASDGARVATAQLLGGGGPGFDPDPWAYARAAELLVSAGAPHAADAAIAKAVRGLDDPHAALEIGSRWFAVVGKVTGADGLFLRLQAAQRCLALGEANDAQRWCESAAALASGAADPTIAVLMGRSLMQLGDLVAARVSLQKAEAAAQDDEMRARVASELAEVAYLGGNLAHAKEQAERTIALATTSTTRLAGRNTLGKIHLSEARWDAADEHFADDALASSAAGDGTAELRARLNRGIALMSKGLLDEARVSLERVLDDGGRCGEDRARAHAHSNLGVIAYRQHDYAGALAHWDATTRFPQALRGRMATALTIANLAELRLRLGLVDHAEHAVAFGRRLLAGSGSPARAAHFKRVAAQIALVRRNSELARREIDAALVEAESSGDRDVLDAVCLVAARVALEDGDVNRAAVAIERAKKHAGSGRAKAEVAILVAHQLRASGLPAMESATEALVLARASGEEDLLAEIHTLLAMLHRDAGDNQAAQSHCARAIAVRDQVAAGLSTDIRAAFLAKSEIVALSRLQVSLASTPLEADPESDGDEVVARAPRATREGAPAREIVGDDPQIRGLLVAIRKVARANSTVLIRGESGTGKELVAEALHRASERANGPLVSVNCAALVETLLLSELFGHEKGAFTGASARRRGRFELAEGGTLFLDEIGDISPRTQVALLRVLQEKTFERVGGIAPIRANVRVICATHRDLKAMVERGEFREDLYYRLRGITLEVPALRARLGDLPKIADHLLGRIALERSEQPKALAQDALELLQRHRWQGNIRELENVLRAVSLFAEGDVITATDLIDNVDDLRTLAQSGPASQPPMSLRGSLLPAPPPSMPVSVPASEGDEEDGEGALPEGESGATAVAYAQVRQGAVSLSDMKRQIERDCIARALHETKGNITRAATLLGMKRPRLSQLVKQYGLSAASSEGSQ